MPDKFFKGKKSLIMSFFFEEPEMAPKLFKTACASPACDSNVASSSALSSVDNVLCCRLQRPWPCFAPVIPPSGWVFLHPRASPRTLVITLGQWKKQMTSRHLLRLPPTVCNLTFLKSLPKQFIIFLRILKICLLWCLFLHLWSQHLSINLSFIYWSVTRSIYLCYAESGHMVSDTETDYTFLLRAVAT